MRRSALRTILYSLVFLLFAIPAQAQTTKWVDQAGGSDANDGNSEAAAYATLQYAIDNSTSGTAATPSVINVKDGTYGITGQKGYCEGGLNGYDSAIVIEDLDYLTIQAVPGHEPVVKPVTAVEANIVSITIDNSNHLIIDNIDSDQTVAQFDNWHFCSDDLTVRNSTFEGGEDGIDFSGDVTAVLIENNLFKDINTGSGDEVIDFTDDRSCSGVVIQDNTFLNNYRQVTLNEGSGNITGFIIRRNLMNGTTSEEAIRLIGASDILIENNVILNNMQQGVYIDSGCSDITLLHNTFFNNDQENGGNGEIRTKVTSADIVIKDNIFYANGSNDIFETTVASLPGEDYNLVYNSPQIGSFTFGANTLTGLDPLFVSTAAGSEDLHLQAGSPAIAAGTDLGVTDDKDKSVRPSPAGSAPDMGAYELGGPPAPKLAKQDVLDSLMALYSTGDYKTDKRLMKAVEQINKSLEDDLWEDDSHLTKKGKKVFVREKKAAHELMKIDPGVVDVSQLILDLVAIDESLALTALEEAALLCTLEDCRYLDKAYEEKTRAEQEYDEGDYDKAIDRYKKVWYFAQKALKKCVDEDED